MRRVVKWAVILVAAVAVVGGSSDWLTARGYDFWRYSEYKEQLTAGESLSETLDHRLENSEGRLTLKEDAVREFIAGRTTFVAVVALFQQVNEGNDRITRYMHSCYPAADDREIAARNALLFIAAALPKDAPGRGPTLTRARAEFDRQFPHPAGPSS